MEFPFADQAGAKLRPVLLLRPVPGLHADWLVAMISSRLFHAVPGFDLVLTAADADFEATGLRVASVIRLGRLAVVGDSLLRGRLGVLQTSTLAEAHARVASWIAGTRPV